MSETNSTPAASAAAPAPAPAGSNTEPNSTSIAVAKLYYNTLKSRKPLPKIDPSQTKRLLKTLLTESGVHWKVGADVYKLTKGADNTYIIKKLIRNDTNSQWENTTLNIETTLSAIDETKIGYCPPTITGGARKSRRHRKHSKKQRKSRRHRK